MYLNDFLLALCDLLVKKLDVADHFLLKSGLPSFDEKGENFLVVAFDESGGVLMDDSDVALEGPDDISEESVLLDNILLELPVDKLQTSLVLEISLSLHVHDLPDGLYESLLKLACSLYLLDLLKQ